MTRKSFHKQLQALAALAAGLSLAQIANAQQTSVYDVDTFDMAVASDGRLSLSEVMEAISTNAPVGDAPQPVASGQLVVHLPAGTFVVPGALPAISRGTTFVAQGGTAVLQQNNYSRLFNLTGTEDFSFTDIELRGGGFESPGEARGGGILHEGPGALALTRCRFENCYVASSGGFAALGGAVYTTSRNVTITDSWFSANNAYNYDGNLAKKAGPKGAVLSDVQGGAIYLAGDGTTDEHVFRFEGTGFDSCYASAGAAISRPSGAAIYSPVALQTVVIDRCYFANNYVSASSSFTNLEIGTVTLLSSFGASMLTMTGSQFYNNYNYASGTAKGIDLTLMIGAELRGNSFLEAWTYADVASAIHHEGGFPLRMQNNTIYKTNYGVAAIASAGFGPVELAHNSIADNGGGIVIKGSVPSVNLGNNYIVGNATGMISDFDVTGSIGSLGAKGNMIGYTTVRDGAFDPGTPNDSDNFVYDNQFTEASDVVPGFFGGRTVTLALVPCSDALDAGALELTGDDQRLTDVRPQDATGLGTPKSDIGAFEAPKDWSNLDVIRVQPDVVSGNAVGQSWADAIDDLQTALDLASQTAYHCDKSEAMDVWIKAGTYRPLPLLSRLGQQASDSNSFKVEKDGAIYGGFCGTENDPSERPARLSGEPGKDRIKPVLGCSDTVLSGDVSAHSSFATNTKVVLSIGEISDVLVDRVTVRDAVGTISRIEVSLKGVSGNGGGIRFSGTSAATLNDVIVEDNTSESSGAGIVAGSTALTITDSVIRNNNSDQNGGGIFAGSGKLTISNSTFSGNEAASGSGGGIYQGGGTLTIANSTFESNLTGGFGGAIHHDGDGEVTRTTFSTNHAAGGGGAIALNSSADLVIKDHCSFISNAAQSGGGAIVSYATSWRVQGSVFFGNDAPGADGGAILDSSLDGAIVACIFRQNGTSLSTLSGGAVSLQGDRTKVYNSFFQDNRAGDGGAIFSAPTSGAELVHNTIFSNSADNRGGGIHAGSSTDLANNLIGGNTAGSAGPDVSGSVQDYTGFNNLICDVSGSSIAPGPGTGGNITSFLDTSVALYFAPSVPNGSYFKVFEPIPDSQAWNAATTFSDSDLVYDIVNDSRSPRVVGDVADYGAKEAGDLDGDGVLDFAEKSVPSNGSSSLPNGDGDGDNQFDYLDAKVVSLRGADDSYLSFRTSSGTFSEMTLVTDPSEGIMTPDELAAAPLGWFDFSVIDFTPDSQVSVDVYLANALPAGIYDWFKWGPRAFNPGESTLFPFQATSPTSNGGFFVDRATTRQHFLLKFKDGEEGDSDLTSPDGVIRDPGGPALASVLAVTLGDFSASVAGQQVIVSWATVEETNNAGFNVYRAVPNGSGGFTVGEKINATLIPAEALGGGGASYSFVDPASLGADEDSRSYFLVDIDLSGAAKRHGPATAVITKTEVRDWYSF
ncbi:hypothetical protein GC173_03550 [bacterium]|nr:hypothetical protein [bacterium]